VTTIDNSLAIHEEIIRKNDILHKVESFLGEAQFMELIGKWREENVYKYVFNAGYLYQFEDTMSATNQRIGRDEDYLCFKQLCYKRVNNPVDFINTFADKIKKQELINVTNS
jgi:hypothetical protein